MAQRIQAPLPPDQGLWAGCVVRVTAVDPTTGVAVAGVVVSDVSIAVENLAGGDLSSGQFLLVPGPGS